MKLLTKKHGLAIARIFRKAVVSQGYPVQRMFIYGSVSRGQATKDSDLDIAIICKPFARSRHEENMVFRRIRRDIDARIEPFTLHPEDFTKPYFALPYEVEKDGMEVS